MENYTAGFARHVSVSLCHAAPHTPLISAVVYFALCLGGRIEKELLRLPTTPTGGSMTACPSPSVYVYVSHTVINVSGPGLWFLPAAFLLMIIRQVERSQEQNFPGIPSACPHTHTCLGTSMYAPREWLYVDSVVGAKRS